MIMDYKTAGVDVEKGDLFVERIKGMIRETYDARVVSGVGGFAALYEMDEERLLATGTDGVGTKVKLAQELNIHDTIGQDLVAMCVNDVLCTGARPMFFLDYLATGKLDLEVSTEILKGVVNACKLAGCALWAEKQPKCRMYTPRAFMIWPDFQSVKSGARNCWTEETAAPDNGFSA